MHSITDAVGRPGLQWRPRILLIKAKADELSPKALLLKRTIEKKIAAAPVTKAS